MTLMDAGPSTPYMVRKHCTCDATQRYLNSALMILKLWDTEENAG